MTTYENIVDQFYKLKEGECMRFCEDIHNGIRGVGKKVEDATTVNIYLEDKIRVSKEDIGSDDTDTRIIFTIVIIYKSFGRAYNSISLFGN